jgi:hypothetical protein
MPDLDEEVELPPFKEPIRVHMTRSPALKIPDSQQDDPGQGSAPTSTQEPSDFIFDVFAEGDDEPPRQPTKPITLDFPSSTGAGNLAALLKSPQPATQPETGSEQKTESWDAHKGHIQEVIGERHSATGLECQVVICTTRWLLRAANETKLLRRFRKRQRA